MPALGFPAWAECPLSLQKRSASHSTNIYQGPARALTLDKNAVSILGKVYLEIESCEVA